MNLKRTSFTAHCSGVRGWTATRNELRRRRHTRYAISGLETKHFSSIYFKGGGLSCHPTKSKCSGLRLVAGWDLTVLLTQLGFIVL